MKVLKLFKKPALIAAVVLLAMLTVMAVVTVSAEGEIGGTVKSYQVNMRGMLGMIFNFYDVDKGMTDGDYYTVKVGDEEPLKYPIEKIREANAIEVRLKPTQMGDTIVVTAHHIISSETGETTQREVSRYSVEKYANTILGSSDLKAWHDDMTALLNWGDKSYKFFEGGESTVKDSLGFTRGTDPSDSVSGDIWAPSHSGAAESSGSFTKAGSEMNLALDEGNISFRFYIASTCEAKTLSATISRAKVNGDGTETKTVTAVKQTDGRYLISIDSIGTPLFEKLYTVTITDTDGATYTVYASVLEYLKSIVTAPKSEEQRNVAQSLYHFYQFAQGKINAATCNHGAKGTYTVSNGTKETFNCANCYTELEAADGVTVYVPAGSMYAQNPATWEKVEYVDSKLEKPNKEDNIVWANSSTKKAYPWVNVTKFNMGNRAGDTDYSLGTNDVDGSKYFSFTMGTEHGTTSQFIWNRDASGSRSVPNEVFVNNVGNAEYFVIKARVSENTDTQLKLIISTVEGSKETGYFPIAAETAGEWVTYVVPLKEVFTTAYVANGNGTYDIDHFYLELVDSTSKPTLDIQYFAFAENWNGVKAVADQDIVVKSIGKAATECGIVDAETGKICLEHVYPAQGAQICLFCGDKGPVDYYISPEAIRSLSGGGLHGTMDRTVMIEDGVKFVRINKFAAAGDWGAITPVNTSNEIVTGQYLVMKVRVGQNGLGQTNLQFYITTKAEPKDAWVNGGVKVKLSEDGEWHVIVVDLAARVASGYFNATEGAYTAKYLQMRPFSGKQAVQVGVWETNDEGLYVDKDGAVLEDQASETGRVPVWKTNADGKYVDKDGAVLEDQASETGRVQVKVWQSIPEADDYMDIAYFAFVDSLDDIKEVVSEDEYEKSLSNTVNHKFDKTTHACTEPTPATAPTIDGTKYTYKCTVCDAIAYEKTIPASVTAYVTPMQMKTVTANKDKTDKWISSTQFNMAGQAIAQNGNVPYFTFTKGAASHNTAIYIWNRDNAAGADQRSAQEIYTINVGQANYFVLKMRVADNTQDFTLTLSTVGTAENYYKNDSSLPYGDPRGTTKFPLSETTNGEWVTYVLDLEKVFGDAYNPSADGTYDLDTFVLQSVMKASATSIDIEYFAFIESDVASLKNMIDEDEFKLVHSLNGVTNNVITTATGKCVAHINAGCDTICDFCGEDGIEGTGHNAITYTSSTNSDSDKVWKTNCSYCGFEHETVVPAEVNFFGDLKSMGYFTSNSSTLTRYMYDEVNDVLYNHITTASSTHVNITGNQAGSNGAVTTNKFIIGKYLIIKYRTPSSGAELSISGGGIGTDKTNITTLGKNKSTEWQVAVIDMQTLIDEGKIPTTASTFYLSLLASKEVDIAYVATVDTLDEMRELVTDSEYAYYGTSFSNTPETVAIANDPTPAQ